MAGGGDSLAVKPDIAGLGERRGVAAGAHHTGVPEPFVDALAIQVLSFVVLLELLLERGELGEGRIGIRRLITVGAARTAMGLGIILITLGFFDAIALVTARRAVTARRTAGLAVEPFALALDALLTIMAFLALLAVGTFLVVGVRRPVGRKSLGRFGGYRVSRRY